jgi:hypothetical protein
MKQTYISWTDCREIARTFYGWPGCNRRGILLRLPASRAEPQFKRLRVMSEQLQDKMKLSKRRRFRFDRTAERADVFYIELPGFWRKPHAFDFMTAFVRAAKGRKHDSFKDVLREGKYLKNTRHAVDLFINGRTRYKPLTYFAGWRDTFKDKSRASVRRLLV